MIDYLKRSHPPFNDTYLHALSYKTFYNSFFFVFDYLFIYFLSSVDDFHNILSFIVMIDYLS